MSRTREREKVGSVFIVQRFLFLRYHTRSIGRFTLAHTRRLRKNRQREDISGELLFRPYFLRISRSATICDTQTILDFSEGQRLESCRKSGSLSMPRRSSKGDVAQNAHCD